MLLELIANAAPADPQISGTWITGFVVAVIGAIAAGAAHLKGKAQGRAEATETTIKSPVPVVTTRTEPRWASHEDLLSVKADLDELKGDMDRKLDKLLEGQQERGKVAREALNNVHRRMDASTEAVAELKGEVHQMSKNVERLLTLATTPKTSR